MLVDFPFNCGARIAIKQFAAPLNGNGPASHLLSQVLLFLLLLLSRVCVHSHSFIPTDLNSHLNMFLWFPKIASKHVPPKSISNLNSNSYRLAITIKSTSPEHIPKVPKNRYMFQFASEVDSKIESSKTNNTMIRLLMF